MTTPAARSFAAALGVLAALVSGGALAGCGRGGTHEITQVVEREDAGDPAPEATLAQRFRPGGDVGGDPHARLAMPGMPRATGGAPRAAAWTWTTPEGWRESGPGPMREMAWTVAGAPEVLCSFSVLSGAGGGLGQNVDRWRKQMSLEPAGDAGLSDLPRQPMLGGQAVRVELTGTYTGMGERALEGAKLVGLVVELPGRTAFLKLTGPAAAVDAAAPRLLELAASLRPASASSVTEAPSAGDAAAPDAPDTTPSPFTWAAPPEWKRQGAQQLRLATYVPRNAPGTRIVVSRLVGRAGGARTNIDRWRAQMGLEPPATDAEYGALKRATILGGPAVFLALDGRFEGMSGAAGAEAQEGARLVAVAIERAKDMVFVKMTGPVDEVRREEARFHAFCESFRE